MLWLKCSDKLGETVYFLHGTKVVCQASRDVKVKWLSFLRTAVGNFMLVVRQAQHLYMSHKAGWKK